MTLTLYEIILCDQFKGTFIPQLNWKITKLQSSIITASKRNLISSKRNPKLKLQ